MPILAFTLAVLFIPVMPAGASVPRMALLSVALPALVAWRGTPITLGPALFMTFLVVSLFWSPNQYFALNDLWMFILWALAFAIGRTLAPAELRNTFAALALGLGVNSLVVIAQRLGLVELVEVTEWSGLFMNKNFAAEAAAMVFAGVVYYRLWWLAAAVAPTLLLTSARGALVALAVVSMAALWGRSRLVAFGAFAATVATALYVQWGMTPFSVVERLQVWLDVVPALSWWGHGLGSFYAEFPLYQVRTNALSIRFEHPHMDLLQIWYEFGVVGLAFSALLVVRLCRVVPDGAVYGLGVFLVCGLFAFPLYNPVTGFLAALCFGWIYRPGAALRGSVDRGGRGVLRGDAGLEHARV